MPSPGSPELVVFACVHNAGRSQMAVAFFNAAADPGKARALSAGTEPATRVHPEVVAAMGEIGIDVSGAVPRRLTADLAAGARLLVTWAAATAARTSPAPRWTTGRCPIRRGRPSGGCGRSAMK